MKPKKFSLNKISKQLNKAWSPKNVETVDNFVLRIAKFDGKYHWHKHDKDELFVVLNGKIKILTRKENIILNQGEGVKIPRGIEHCPVSLKPSIVLMFEPLKLKSKGDSIDVTDTFGKLKRKISGRKFKDMARKGW